MRWINECFVSQTGSQKYGSQKWGKVWKKVTESLNGLSSVCELYFKATQQSVHSLNRYKLLVDKNE